MKYNFHDLEFTRNIIKFYLEIPFIHHENNLFCQIGLIRVFRKNTFENNLR